MRWIAVVLFLSTVLTVQARADISVTNFFNNPSAGHADGNRVVTFTQDGKQTDFHDSTILQWPIGTNNFYRYSEQYGCGEVYLNADPWCGIHVWYSSDLGADGGPGWRDLGLLFDPIPYNSRCSVVTADGGCWTFRIVYNAANNNFVAWMHDPDGTGYPAVFVCSPSGAGPPVPDNANCTEQTRPTALACGAQHIDTLHLFVDNDGPPASAYVIYSCQNFTVHIDKLNANYTDSNGSTISTPAGIANTEGETLFKNGATYYIVYPTATCPYCDAVAVNYATASSPLGTWTAQGQINSDGCNGQHEGLDKVTIAGTDYFLWHSDLWTNQVGDGAFNNQGMAMEMIQPLSFTAGAINTISCETSFTITNSGITAAPNQPALVPIADQTDESSPFAMFCNVTSTLQIMQTFVPSFSASKIFARVTTAQNLNKCVVADTGCGTMNGNLIVQLVTLDVSNNPVTVLASATITPHDVGWRLSPVVVELDGSVTSGTHYGLIERGINTVGCWAYGYNENLPYASGLARFSSDSGATWATISGRSFRFAIAKSASGLSGIGASVH